MAGYLKIDPVQKKRFEPVLQALEAFPKDSKIPGLLVIRPGYRHALEGSQVKSEPTIVLSVAPRQYTAAFAAVSELQKRVAAPLVLAEATLDEQFDAYDSSSKRIIVPDQPKRSEFEAALRLSGTDELAGAEIVGKTYEYEKPAALSLPLLDEEMTVTVSASPDDGWPVLEKFIRGTKKTLTMGMYQFTAPHIVDAVTAVMKDKDHGDMLLTLHPVPEPPAHSGVKAGEVPEELGVRDLRKALKGRFGFQWAPTGSVFATAYHIKVLVADSAVTWLSSGNHQSSNQPGPAVLADPPSNIRKLYNRDYHAVVRSKRLSEIFEGYLKYDFEVARTTARPAPGKWEGPDVLVPNDYEAVDEVARVFAPVAALELPRRRVKVQPLLTPDNYPQETLKFIRSAKRSLYFQNQYINLSPKGNSDEFQALVEALLALQGKPDFDLKIICRDMMTSDKLDLLVAMGFDENNIRFQPACHNKCIIVDGEAILFGSQNFSNDGVGPNRDASLIFYDKEIAKYFTAIYLYDWENLATAHPAKPRRSPRIVESDEDDKELMGAAQRVPVAALDFITPEQRSRFVRERKGNIRPSEEVRNAKRAPLPDTEIAEINQARADERRKQWARTTQPADAPTLAGMERVIGVTADFRPFMFLERGFRRGRAVGRVVVKQNGPSGPELIGYGTGFLIAPHLLMTNNHVLWSKEIAALSSIQFNYEIDLQGNELTPDEWAFDVGRCFITSPANELDFTIVGVASRHTTEAGATYGSVPIRSSHSKIGVKDDVNIIQHPEGHRKEVVLTENKVTTFVEGGFVRYTADTLEGSSGSCVFNDQWDLVALHHRSVQKLDAKGQPVIDDKGQAVFESNEGIRISAIIDYLKSEGVSEADRALVSTYLYP